MHFLTLLLSLPQVVLVPLVANVPQALPIEVLQVPEPQAALSDRQREEEERKGELE